MISAAPWLRALAFAAICAVSTIVSAAGMNGAVILHGNGETPRHVAELADALRRENVLVATPELPWSGRRFYDRAAAVADTEIEAAIAGVRDQGARRVYLVGQSLGATYALRYGSRQDVTGIVAIAPGHAAESAFFARSFADDLRRAREHIARGQPHALLDFLDMQWGNRRSRARAPAAAFLSYFDAAGPLNLTRNVEQLRSDALVLWILPGDDPAAAQRASEAYARARVSPGSRIIQLPGTYQRAIAGSAQTIVEWMNDTVPHIRTD